MEGSKSKVRLEGEMMVFDKQISIDTNHDGEPVLEIELKVKLHLSEIPDEVYDAWKNRKK